MFIYSIYTHTHIYVKVNVKVTCGQVWWPILRICALHLSHPQCTHTAVNTHTPWTHNRSSGQPFMLRCLGSIWGFSALLKGTSVVVLRVERVLYIHSPTYNPCQPETQTRNLICVTLDHKTSHKYGYICSNSSTGIFVSIANNPLYGSKLSIFLLCQKSLGY